MRIIGVHQHIGSGIRDSGAYVAAMSVLLGVVLRLQDQLPDLRYVDVGGGIGVPYRPSDHPVDLKLLGARVHEAFAVFQAEFRAASVAAHGELAYLRPLPRLILEPGRFLVAESGFLVARVNTLKDVAGRTFAGIDSGEVALRLLEASRSLEPDSPLVGFNHLVRPCMYGAC